jgi:hypothetical protein
MENCRERNRRGESSTAAAEQIAIQCRAAPVIFIVLAWLAVDMGFAAIDVIVDEHTFFARNAFEASAQQQGNVRGHGQALFSRRARSSSATSCSISTGAKSVIKSG